MNKVIAISGHPGSGKSSLAHELCKRMPGVYLDYDNYQNITDHPVHEVNHWMQQGADYDNFVIPALAADLYRLKSGKSVNLPDNRTVIQPREYIFFETPLGRAHKEFGRQIDILIWLDVPMDVALARNVKAFTGIFLKNSAIENYAGDLQWLESYLANYLEHIREMLLLQYEKIARTADIIVNAEAGIDRVATDTIEKLAVICKI